jgi:hypothetical protein
MSTEKVECALQDDSRLIAAVGAIVSHAAKRAGLSEQEQEEAGCGSIDACRKTFAMMRAHGQRRTSLQLVVEAFPDRIILTVEPSGESTLQASSASKDGPAKISGFDRVHYDTSNGRSRMILTRYGPLKPRPVD